MERYVGILLNDAVYRELLSSPQANEFVPHFEEAGAHFGVVPVYLRLKALKAAKSKTEALIRVNQRFKPCTIPVPKVIYNRAVFYHPSSIDFLSRWTASGKNIFNSCYHYSLHDIHQLLSLDASLCRYLPPLWPATGRKLEELKAEHTTLELIPEQGSPASGLLYLTCEDGQNWELTVPNQPENTVLHEDLLLTLQIMDYCVRPVLPLMKSGSRPCVIRMCLQKDETASWKITGMTDVPDWKRAQPGEDIPALSPQELKKDEFYNEICLLSKQISQLLSLSLPSIAEVGLEFGITAEGMPLFLRWYPDIGRTFAQLGMETDAASICQTPIGYARHLLGEHQKFTEQQHALSP
ncbi:YheC/YheD family protein [Paenibacillus senegalensis]|uniref:YheC/YheD family protein n=1 Tax=Paenibacillus senegalensis TaxID=1465766 RepID=UPI0002891367|nr:YheC/YheD family protein [Paenibacillus senegalensis]